jgi:hypothetical protein
MARRGPRKPYKGVLRERLEHTPATFATAFIALLDHYEIKMDGSDGDPWAILARRLAFDHVPTFQGPPRTSGRRATKAIEDAWVSVLVFMEKETSPKKPVTEIISKIAKVLKKKPASLRTRYHLANKPGTPERKRMARAVFGK